MQYHGKLYGKVGGKYFDTGETSESFDATKNQEWISVKDRLPEKHKEVIGYFPNGNESGELIGMAFYDGENVRSSFPNSTSYIYECSHYMPLPLPPKQ